MTKTIKTFKIENKKVVLAKKQTDNREEVQISVEEQDLTISDDWDYNRILNDGVGVACQGKLENGSFSDIASVSDWKVSIHKGWIHNNIVLLGDGQRNIVSSKPVIGHVGYNSNAYWLGFFGILFTGALIWGLWRVFTKKSQVEFGKVTEIQTNVNPIGSYTPSGFSPNYQ